MTPRHYHFIDALRGYAILAVMAVHSSQAATAWDGVGRQIVNQGARGVQLFFVASALTLILSWHSRNDGAIPFYFRRLFRIAPMFWLGMIFFLCLDGFGPRYFAPNGVTWGEVVLTGIFLNGWHPESITSIVPGGWSIAVEMTFYLVFPALFFLIRGLTSSIIALALAIAFADKALQFTWAYRSALWPGISDDLVSTFLNLWFPSQIPVFAIGFLAFFVIRAYRGMLPRWGVNTLLTGSLLLMIGLAFHQSPLSIIGQTISIHTAYGLCFGIFAFCLADSPASWLVNAPIRYLGKISFSDYLWHFALLGIVAIFDKSGAFPPSAMGPGRGFPLFLALFLVVVIVTVTLSSASYYLIERPMIRLGNRWLDGRWPKSDMGKAHLPAAAPLGRALR